MMLPGREAFVAMMQATDLRDGDNLAACGWLDGSDLHTSY